MNLCNLEEIENSVLLWDKELVIPLLTSLKLAPGSAEHAQYINAPSSSYSEDHNASGIPLYQPSYPTSQKTLKCCHCTAIFGTREEQVKHYSSDWHRFNLKRSIEGASCVTFEQFKNGAYEEKEEEDECEANNSNSDEEDEESSDEECISLKRKPRVFFVNADKELISIFRNILQHKKTELSNGDELIHRANAAPRKLYWIIILVGGGHFSGAVYKGAEVVEHKTFHSYTVRAKQGGSQSGRDNKNATSHPRSAGASLRRYNEQSFNQHIQELMEEWKDYISKCDLIFCRCPKKNNQLLFGGQNPVLSRSDFRFRTIPFPTKKPTFVENKKVHRNLSQVYVYGKIKDLVEMEKEKLMNKSSPLRTKLNKEDKIFKKLSKGHLAEIDTHQGSSNSPSDDDLVDQLTTSFRTSDFGLLDPFGSSIEDKKNKKKRKKKNKNDGEEKCGSEEDNKELLKMKVLESFFYSSCRTGNLSKLNEFAKFSEQRDYTDIPDAIPKDVIEAILTMDKNWDWKSIKFGVQQNTPLHVAADNGHKDVIWWLLEAGCDPCVTNKQKETPFVATKVKESKNHFRRFMAEFPEKYNYQKANITSPLTKEQEGQQKTKQAEKKKQQKKAKQEKEKEAKKEEEKRRKEEIEKEKYLNLSDREKRALAAERRILASQNVSTSRCFQCASDLSQIVPFEYCEFKFCSTNCVKEHRTKNKPI